MPVTSAPSVHDLRAEFETILANGCIPCASVTCMFGSSTIYCHYE